MAWCPSWWSIQDIPLRVTLTPLRKCAVSYCSRPPKPVHRLASRVYGRLAKIIRVPRSRKPRCHRVAGSPALLRGRAPQSLRSQAEPWTEQGLFLSSVVKNLQLRPFVEFILSEIEACPEPSRRGLSTNGCRNHSS